MIIYIKNKHSLKIDDFYLKCCIGKNGLTKNKKEGDKKTPIGRFSIEKLYYRSDRIKKPLTRLKCIKIQKKMGWCDDPLDKKNYNKLMDEENLDAVLGSRFIKNSKIEAYPIKKLILNRIFNFFVSIIFFNSYNDYTNAFKIYKKNVLLNICSLVDNTPTLNAPSTKRSTQFLSR